MRYSSSWIVVNHYVISLQNPRQQIETITRDPEELKKLPHLAIHHDILRTKLQANGIVPETGSLYEEAQALILADLT